MNGANNATIAYPGPDWHMLWPTSFEDFQLDIVGFLAILGEGSISSVAQVSALSRLFYFPRLLPAPQALLRTSRPTFLEPTNAAVSAFHSGNFKDHLHHVAHVLLGEEMEPFTVRCVKVTKKLDTIERNASWADGFFRGVERTKASKAHEARTPPVKAKANGPILYVTLLDFALSISLFIISIALGDTMSLVATLLLSFLSTLIGIGNKWTLKLPKRPEVKPEAEDSEGPSLSRRHTSEDDIEMVAGLNNAGKAGERAEDAEEAEEETEQDGVVIRYPNGSYMVVLCDEGVARELYFAPEEIHYTLQNQTKYRMISLVGTLMLMLGVIFLANAKLHLQICWVGAYVVLNAAHWLVAAVPAREHWDLSCYEVVEQGIEGKEPGNSNFTEALWTAIFYARSSKWVRVGTKHAAPQTPLWDAWLAMAEEAAQDPKTADGIPKKHLPRFTPSQTAWRDPNWRAKEEYDNLVKADKRAKRVTQRRVSRQATAGAPQNIMPGNAA